MDLKRFTTPGKHKHRHLQKLTQLLEDSLQRKVFPNIIEVIPEYIIGP